jgi:hypothetical protein
MQTKSEYQIPNRTRNMILIHLRRNHLHGLNIKIDEIRRFLEWVSREWERSRAFLNIIALYYHGK